jgi:hypothetical protein
MHTLFGGACSGFFSAGLICDLTRNLKHLLVTITYIIIMNKWTLALAAAGIVSMAAVASAEEADNQVLTAVSGTTISGYVDTSMNWQFGDKKTSAGRASTTEVTSRTGST